MFYNKGMWQWEGIFTHTRAFEFKRCLASPIPAASTVSAFYDFHIHTGDSGEKDKNDKKRKKKKRGWGLYQLHPKKEKHSRKLLTLLVSFVVVFQVQTGVLVPESKSWNPLINVFSWSRSTDPVPWWSLKRALVWLLDKSGVVAGMVARMLPSPQAERTSRHWVARGSWENAALSQ